MIFLYIAAGIYLSIGLVYAIYVVVRGFDNGFWHFFINWLVGPIFVIATYFKLKKKKDLRIRP